jgi:hypothetical protein
MSTKKISERSEATWNCLKEAVYNELRKKALLGQYAIIQRDGKTCRITAEEALKMAVPDDKRPLKDTGHL